MKNILITGASGNLGRTIVAAFEQVDDEYHINIISREEKLFMLTYWMKYQQLHW